MTTSDADLGERLVSDSPVRVRRRVAWGDCDPAQVVYTPRFADYAASAIQWFNRTRLAALRELDLLTPLKALSFEFLHVLRPHDLFDLMVYVTDVRTRTYDLGVVAVSSADGNIHFIAHATPILVTPRDFTATPIPASLRSILDSYREEFAPPAALLERTGRP